MPDSTNYRAAPRTVPSQAAHVPTVAPSLTLTSTSLSESVRADIAAVLYRNVPTVLLCMSFSSTTLAIVCDTSHVLSMFAWWLILNSILLVRLFNYRKMIRRADWIQAHPEDTIRRFSIGAVITSLMWAAYPFILFAEQSAAERMLAAIVISALASTGSTMLASVFSLATFFVSALVLPTTVFLLTSGDRIQSTMGILGLLLYGAILFTTHVNGKATLNAFRTRHEYERLAKEVIEKNIETVRLNDSLQSAQQLLQESNEQLERRVRDRTEALWREANEKAIYASRLEKLASSDALTHLLNRTAFMRELNRRMLGSPGEVRSIKCLFIDLDRFKEVNDVLGHLVGDIALQETARRIRAALPHDAIIGRWGGDEFVAIVTQGQDHGDPLIEANAIRALIAQPLQAGENLVHIGSSIGVALAPQHQKTPEELVSAADMAMYSVKTHGRPGACLFDPKMAEATHRRHNIGQALRHALDAQQFSLAFQPIVHAKTSRLHRMEALLRWHDPVRGAVSPSEFIPVAEDNGLIIPLGEWVLEQACAAAKLWPDHVAVAVNVSVAQILSAERFLDAIDATLEKSGLPPCRLEIEITETLFAHDFDRISTILQALRMRGIRVAIDDFGMGYSSLGYLGTLPVDVVKIDQSFVNDIDNSGGAIIRAILGLAHGLGFSVVAEGVESNYQREQLSALGVDYLQGYLISRPIHHGAVAGWMDDFTDQITLAPATC